MLQCPSCASFNDPQASYCNQCGRPFTRSQGFRVRRRQRLGSIAGGLLFLGLVAAGFWGWRAWFSGDGAVRSPFPFGHRPKPLALPPAAPGAGPVAGEEAEQTPDAETVRRQVEQATVALELEDARGRPLAEVRGLLLGSGETVLARFSPLLGAYAGRAKTARAGEAAREIEGLVAYDPYRDLVLLELAPSAREVTGLSVIEGGDQALAPGVFVSAVSAGRLVETTIAEYPYAPDGVARALLADESALPLGAFAAVDAYGAVIGLVRNVPSAESTGDATAPASMLLVVDPLSSALSVSVGRRAVMTLSQVSHQFFEGTLPHLVGEARAALEAREFLRALETVNQALELIERDGIVGRPQEEALAVYQRALDGAVSQHSDRQDHAGVASLLAGALRWFPGHRHYWIQLGGARMALGSFEEALAAILEARKLQAGTDVDVLLQKCCLDAAAREVSLGRAAASAEWLDRGIQLLPTSSRLRLELAGLYAKLRLYDDARAMLAGAREIDPAVSPEVEVALARIDDELSRQQALVIEIPEGASSIGADVAINGALTFRFIVDTGATFTSIPQSFATQLGYQIGPNHERVVIRTASDLISAPVIVLESVSLSGYAVRNVKAIVLADQGGDARGLLGLNFLNQFKYSVNPERREFRLERR